MRFTPTGAPALHPHSVGALRGAERSVHPRFMRGERWYSKILARIAQRLGRRPCPCGRIGRIRLLGLLGLRLASFLVRFLLTLGHVRSSSARAAILCLGPQRLEARCFRRKTRRPSDAALPSPQTGIGRADRSSASACVRRRVDLEAVALACWRRTACRGRAALSHSSRTGAVAFFSRFLSSPALIVPSLRRGRRSPSPRK